MIKQEYYNIIQQSIRELHIRISLLNSKFKKVDELKGICLGGNINVDANSDIRRACNVSCHIKDSSFLVGNDKKIWMDKYTRIEIGIRGLRSGEIVWFDQGIFLLNQPSINYNSTNKTLNFQGVDLMARFTGSRDGTLTNKTIIPANMNISESMKTTVKDLGGFPNVYVESTTRVTPYDIEKKAGDSVYSLMKELSDLYMDWEKFFKSYNGKPMFYYQEVKSKENDSIVLDFTQLKKDLVIDSSYNYDFENIKNKVAVYGKLLDDGTQVAYTKVNDNPESPFNINTDIGTIEYVYNDDRIYDIEQAQTRADYELWKHSDLKDALALSVVPIYFLDVNQKIKYTNKEIGVDGEFLIQSLTIPLDVSSTMSINAIKLY